MINTWESKPKIGKVLRRRHSTVLNELTLYCSGEKPCWLDYLVRVVKFQDCAIVKCVRRKETANIDLGFQKAWETDGLLRVNQETSC